MNLNAVALIVRAAADAASRADAAARQVEATSDRADATSAHAADASECLLEASGRWSVLADMVLCGARLPKAWVREHAAHADSLAAQATAEFRPTVWTEIIVSALYTR